MPLLKEPPLWYGTHTAWRRVGLLYRHPQPSRHLMGVGAPRGPPGGRFWGSKTPKNGQKTAFFGYPLGGPKKGCFGTPPPSPLYQRQIFVKKRPKEDSR